MTTAEAKELWKILPEEINENQDRQELQAAKLEKMATLNKKAKRGSVDEQLTQDTALLAETNVRLR